MRKIPQALLSSFMLLVTCHAVSQSSTNLYVDFGMQGFSQSAGSVTLNRGGTYFFADLCGNLCTNNYYNWYFTRTDGQIATGITINGENNNYSFGNGGNNLGRPSVSFSLPGIYNVRLVVQKAYKPAAGEQFCFNQTGERFKQGFIVVPYIAPVPAFNSNASAVNKSLAAGSIVSFTDVSTNSPTNWQWTITPSTGWSYTSGNGGAQNPKVNFSGVGTYTVALKATNPGGNNVITKSNHITVVPIKPVVDFSANGSSSAPVSVQQNMITNFNDLSLYDPSSWAWTISPATGWSFVSGTNINSRNPIVNFTNIGSYSISLTAANAGGSAAKVKTNFLVVFPQPPILTNDLVKYCQGSAALPLQASGTALKWYTVSTGGVGSSTAPTPSTVNAGVYNYYVTQTVGGFESARAAMIVVVNALPVNPAVNPVTTECAGAAASALSATGTNVKWYTVATGGIASSLAPVPVTTAAGTFLNYVSQTDSKGCESKRSLITVNVIASLPIPYAPASLTYCLSAQASKLTASTTVGTDLQWFDVANGGTALAEAPTPLTASTGTTTYYVAQTKPGCATGARAPISVNVNDIPTPGIPIFNSPVVYTVGENALPLSATGTSLRWYTSASGGMALAFTPLPGTGLVGTVPYFVTQTVTGCESPRAQLDVITNPGVPVAAPNWAGASGINISSSDLSYAKNILNLGGGEVIVTGLLGSSNIFGKNLLNQDVSLTKLADKQEGFLVKYNATGNVLWATKLITANGIYSEIQPSGIAKAPSGGVYITGRFTGSINFGSVALSSTSSNPDIFVARFDALGKIVWAKSAGNPTVPDVAYSIVSDNDGFFYITGGVYGGSANFGSLSLTGVGTGGYFVAKYDKNGNAVWTKTDSGISYAGTSICIDANFTQSVDYDIFVVDGLNLYKYDKNGVLLSKSTSISDAATNRPSFSIVSADISGNVFVAGRFQGTVRFDSTTFLTVYRQPGTISKTAAFLAKYNKTGKLEWARKAAGNSGSDAPLDIKVDEYGNVYMAGYFSGTANFGSLPIVSSGTSDGFLLKYGPQGNELWVKRISGTSGTEYPGAISLDELGNLCVYGTGTGVVFDGLAQTAISGRFIAKIGTTLPAPGIFEIFPNPASPGSKINIIGKGLINTYGLYFNDLLADSFKVISAAQIEVTVPFAATTGPITITTPLGTFTDSVNLVIKENVFNDDNLPPAKWRWARVTTRPSTSAGFGMSAVDEMGNIFIAGNYDYRLDLIDTILLAPDVQNNPTIFLSKYDAAGTFKWAVTSGGTAYVELVATETDVFGNVFLSGFINQYDDRVFTLGTTTVRGGGQFIAKFNNDGLLQWVKKIDGQVRGGYGFEMKADKFGNLLIAGSFSGTKKFGSIELSVTGATQDYYIAKFSADGETIWAKQKPVELGGSSLLATDKDGNILNFFSAGVLHKFAPDGTIIWQKTTVPGQLKTDQDNNIFIEGFFNYSGNPIDFGTVVLKSNSNNSGYLYKMDKNGNVLWARKYFDSENALSNTTSSNGIASDSLGNVYLVGVFTEKLLFPKDTLNANGYENVWVAKFDKNGNKVWANSLNQASYQAQSYAGKLFVKGPDDLTLTGLVLNGTIKFGDTSLTAIGSSGNTDLNSPYKAPFIAKMGGIPPAIANFFTTRGSLGDTVTIDGVNFTGASQVRFNGTPTADFSVKSARKILARVPANAATGTIMVATPNGTAKASTEFLITGKYSGTVEMCPGSTTIITSSIAGTSCQWQVDMGNGFVNITDANQYADFTSTSMQIKAAGSSMYGFKYRCLVNGQISDTLNLRFVSSWTGSADDTWDELGNWGCSNKIPDVNTDVFIPSGEVIIRSNVLVRSLTISPGAKVIVEAGYSLNVIKQGQ